MRPACRMARMGPRRAILLAIVAAFGSASHTCVQAQDEEPLSWYAIEVIVFERTGDGGLGAEAWPADPGLPALADNRMTGSVPGLFHAKSNAAVRYRLAPIVV